MVVQELGLLCGYVRLQPLRYRVLLARRLLRLGWLAELLRTENDMFKKIEASTLSSQSTGFFRHLRILECTQSKHCECTLGPWVNALGVPNVRKVKVNRVLNHLGIRRITMFL